MHGIRGEVNCVVKVALFSDANRYRQSSCGFKFFYSPGIPSGYSCEAILGFVEELVVNHDPEYQWIDKIRTPRASNEARQTLFSKISGEVQRKIGIKAIDLGGNAVVRFGSLDIISENWSFDLIFSNIVISNILTWRANLELLFVALERLFFSTKKDRLIIRVYFPRSSSISQSKKFDNF